MFGLSWAAQRGCWKLFHDTATLHAPAAALPLGAGALPLGAAALPLGAAADALGAAADALGAAADALGAAWLAGAAVAAWLAGAVVAAWLAGAGVAPPPLHATARTVMAPSSPALRRLNMYYSSSVDDTTFPPAHCPFSYATTLHSLGPLFSATEVGS